MIAAAPSWFTWGILFPALLVVWYLLFRAFVPGASRRSHYIGHNPKIPDGWIEMKPGEKLEDHPDRKVWGFDGWYDAGGIAYVLRKDEATVFIRPHWSLEMTDAFRRSTKRQDGHFDPQGKREGYESLQ